MVVIADPETVSGRPLCRFVELGWDLVDVGLCLPASRVDVRLDDRLNAEFDGQLTDLILIPAEQIQHASFCAAAPIPGEVQCVARSLQCRKLGTAQPA